MSSPRIVIGDPERKAWIPANSPQMTARASLVRSPEFIEGSKGCFFVPVLNSFQYQDKEVRKKVNRNEDEACKDSVLHLLDIHRDDGSKDEILYLLR